MGSGISDSDRYIYLFLYLLLYFHESSQQKTRSERKKNKTDGFRVGFEKIDKEDRREGRVSGWVKRAPLTNVIALRK